MKKRVFVIILIFLILILNLNSLVLAEDDIPGKDSVLNLTKIEQTKKSLEEQRWDYLSNEWKERIFENEFIQKFDNFMSKPAISYIFKFLIGEPWNFSFQIIAIIILWIWFVLFLSEIFKYQTAVSITSSKPINNLLSLCSSLGITIILSYLKVFRFIIEKSFEAVFKQEIWWLKLIIFIIIISLYGILFYTAATLKNTMKKKKKQQLEEKAELNQQKINEFADSAFQK